MNLINGNININKLISKKDIYCYHDFNLKKLKIDNFINFNTDVIYNVYVTDKIFLKSSIIACSNKYKYKYTKINDIFIDGDLYINSDNLDVVDAIAYSIIPKFIYRREKINILKNKINEKR